MTDNERLVALLLIPPQLLHFTNEPIYVQIYRFYKEEIVCGRMQSQERLPSIRQLALHLNISRNPVEMAYAQLTAEGYITGKAKSGYFAAELDWLPPSSKEQAYTSRAADGIEERTYSKATLSFEYDQTDVEQFPLALWRKMTHKVLQPSERDLLYYGDHKGEIGLRRLIVDYVQQNRGVLCDLEQVVITAGTQQAALMLSGLLQATVSSAGAQDHGPLAVEEAMHPGLLRIFQHQRLNPVPVRLESDGLCVDALTSNESIRAVYVTPSHQFPYGMIMSAAKRMKLLQWAYTKRGIIIEDDYDSDFLYEGRPVPALQGLDSNECVVYLGTFSKALAPALRLSYMILPQILLDRYEREFSFYDQTASRLTQKTMELFMLQGHFDRHVRRMRKVYRHKRETLLRAIQQYMGDCVYVSGAESGLHAILHVTSHFSQKELLQKALDSGVDLRPVSDYHVSRGTAYEVEPESISRFLLGFGGLSSDQIVDGIQRMAKAWAI